LQSSDAIKSGLVGFGTANEVLPAAAKRRSYAVIPVVLFFLLLSLLAAFPGLNNQLFHYINGLAGRSWIFDSLVSQGQENDLVKGTLIGSCFLAAWFGQKSLADAQRVRKILLITLMSCIFVLGTTKTLCHIIFLPRPYVNAAKIYRLEGEQLVEQKRDSIRVPLDESSQKTNQALLSGDVPSEDLGTLPSDHAGFYMVLSLGILLAARSLGLLSILWTVVVIMGGKIITGQHTPLDVMAGAAIALIELAIIRYISLKRFNWLFDKIVGFSLKYTALSSAVIFAIVFELSSTLGHVRQLLSFANMARKHLMGGVI
jgi:membrane-associated phospholipid phosphatase